MGLIFENGFMEINYACVLIFWIIYLYFVKHYGYWEERDVPHATAVFPFGSLSEAVQGRNSWGNAFDKIYKEFKNERYVGFIEIRKPCLLIKDPELIRLILHKDVLHFTDRTWVEVNPKEYIQQHLFNMKGKEWKAMRLKLTPAYTAAKMKMMFFLMKKSSDVLQDVIIKLTEKTNVIDVKDVMSRFTIDIIATCAFGIDVNCLLNKDSEFYRVAKKCTEVNLIVLIKMYIYNAFLIFSKFYCFDFLDSKIRDFLTDMIHTNIAYREKFNINRYDFFDLLMKLRMNQSILEEGEKPPDLGLHEVTTPPKREDNQF